VGQDLLEMQWSMFDQGAVFGDAMGYMLQKKHAEDA